MLLFSETIVVFDIKVGRCSQPNVYINLYEYQRSRSSIDLGKNHSDSIFLNFFSSIITWPIEAKFYVESSWDEGTKACSNYWGYMTKMVTMTINGKILKKSSSPESKGRRPWILVCCIAFSSTIKFVEMMYQSWPGPILWQDQIWSCKKVGQLKWVHEALWVPKVNVIK